MSWRDALPLGAATRTGSLEAREKRRAELETARLLKKQKSEQRRKLLTLGGSNQPSPSSSRAPSPPPSDNNMSTATGGQPAPVPPPALPGNPAGPGGPPDGGPPGGPPGGGGGGPPGGPPGGGGGNGGGQPVPPPPPAAPLVANNAIADYDMLDTDDGPRAIDRSGTITVQIMLDDIQFWFSELESEMQLSAIGSQWLKLSVLRKNLPVKQREDVKSLLRLPKSQSGPTPYYNVKMQLLKLYSVKPMDSFKRAMGRVMTGLPSQLGKLIVDDICTNPIKLQNCCCSKAVQAIWTDKLPVNINAHLSNMDFNYATYQAVFDAADKVYLSAKSISIAAMSDPATAGYSMSAAADDPLNKKIKDDQVSAIQQNKNQRNRNNGNRNNRNTNNGQRPNRNQNSGSNTNQNQTSGQNQGQKPRKGPRHSSNPPHTCCDLHFTKGSEAWYCLKPLSCPWKDKISEQP